MSDRKNFVPRSLMEQAVAVMRASVHDVRDDGRSNPSVGALLWKPDGTVEHACRGELRDGDHAEYTLLERKNRFNPLGDCVLFSTLEPCAPGSRKPPKSSCAQRIAWARIREVWIGIDDPDPTVAGKGIKFLRDHGVEIHMFDRDLQDQITAANEAFISQAMQRARAAQEPQIVPAIVLSSLERRLDSASLDELSRPALEEFRKRGAIASEVGTPEFNAYLEALGLLRRRDDVLAPSGFGYLLLAQHPRTRLQQAGVMGLIEYADGATEPRQFDEPMILIPEIVEDWLRSKLPNVTSRDRMQRSEVPPVPFELVREGLNNALVHRDYDRVGLKVHLTVTPHTITIKSPGLPPPPLTLEQMRLFSAPSLSRNPILHYVFVRMALAEETGLGMRSMRSVAQRLGLPLPRYSWADPNLELTIYRTSGSAVESLPRESFSRLVGTQIDGLKWLSGRGPVTSGDYAAAMAIDERTARRHLTLFIELGLVSKTGSARSTRYEVL